jgi:AcrR family transcriptional regulator
LSGAIEDAALELFADRSMSDVTVEEIANKARVAIRTLYRYFPTKEDVFAGLPRRGAERIARCMKARPATETPFEATRNAMLEAGGDVDYAELDRWLKALVKSNATDRIARMALVVSTAALTEPLTERSGLQPDDLWLAMAGTMISATLIVGARQWAAKGGNLMEHELAALDIVGRGLSDFDPARATGRPNRRQQSV